jgi:predicted transcriptional regulator|tara:strand:- start:1217 stop:1624 length:408 start_codon:yes stop_codon:yes gene_type:complete
MSKTDKKLSEIFDLDPISTTIEPVQTAELVTVEDDVVDSDTDYARKNIRNLIDKGNVAVDNLLQVSKESEHPRAYEVVAGLMKTMADLNKDLLELQKRRKDLKPQLENTGGNITVEKAVFVGSTADLLKQIRDNK